MIHFHHFDICRVFHEAGLTRSRAANTSKKTIKMPMETTTVVLESTLKSSRGLRRDITNPNYPFDKEENENQFSADSQSEEHRLDQSDLLQNVAPDEHFHNSPSHDSDVDEEDTVNLKVSFTTDQKWTVALLKILDEIQAPDHAFRKILTWGREAARDKYSFYPQGGLDRNKQIDMLFNSVENAKNLLPVVCPVPVFIADEEHFTDVIAYDFVPQLLSLLQNRKIMTQENLLIDVSDPLKAFKAPGQVRGDAISGSVYQDAYSKLITNPGNQLFVPIIQWIDKTTVTGNDRFSLKPYMFTPAIFTEKFRRTFPAWAFHGFIPEDHSSAAENKRKKQGDNIRGYHAQLKEVLKTFINANSRLKGVTLPIGKKGFIKCDIVVCLLFIIQDIQEGDTLCGRYGPHTSNIQRHCRNCDVRYAQLDDQRFRCSVLVAKEMHVIAQSDDKVLRQKWSQHALDNAFNYVPFADPKGGIFAATPTEIMHVLRGGMEKDTVKLVLDNVPDSQKDAFDKLAKGFHKKHRQTIRKFYPATDFNSGVTNLSKISHAERNGLIFLFVILSNYEKGWNILDNALQKKTNTTLRKVLNVFEGMLCFDAWLHLPAYWSEANEDESKESVRRSIENLMKNCKTRIPSPNSANWKKPKFHELLHITMFICRFGAPSNYSAERPESLLIPAAKQPGRRSQKRHATYVQQAARRLASSYMISRIHEMMFPPPVLSQPLLPDPCHPNVVQSTKQATRATLKTTRDALTNRRTLHLSWHTRYDLTKLANTCQLPDRLLDFLSKQFGDDVQICTEYRRDEHIFRCHPNYQSDGPIFDWMRVLFDDDKIYPSRLAAVVLCAENAPEPYQLVVQCTTRQTGHKSVLLTEWHMCSDYYVISPESIQAPCFVIEHTDDDSKIHEVLGRELWANEFTHLDDYPDF
jgi:hypothetical protein